MTTPNYSFRVLWSAEDDAYVATSPEFDGISGTGKSAEAALRQARIAVELAIETYEDEGWPLPTAQTVNPFSGQFRVRFPRYLHAQLAQRAADNETSLNTYLISIVSAHVAAAAVSDSSHVAMSRLGFVPNPVVYGSMATAIGVDAERLLVRESLIATTSRDGSLAWQS